MSWIKSTTERTDATDATEKYETNLQISDPNPRPQTPPLGMSWIKSTTERTEDTDATEKI
jgi:hypothetical protein